MQLRRMLLTLFLAGLCCVSLAACTPDNTPSEPESSSSGDTLTTTLLPNGWDAADFTVLLFDKYGPMDGASPVTLTDEEQKELLNLLDISSWEPSDEADAPQHGLTPWLTDAPSLSGTALKPARPSSPSRKPRRAKGSAMPAQPR